MRNGERDFARRKLDEDCGFTAGGKGEAPYPGVVAEGAAGAGVPVAEVARELGVNRSVIFRLEQSEGGDDLAAGDDRVANAMNCKVVYAVIPHDGKTLEEMADRRKWSKLLG